MKTVIYYFTGTGNSLAIARYLAGEMENVEVLPMAKLLKMENITTNADRIGMVFPVYYLDMPELVKEFLKKLVIEKEQPYIFAVVNCGNTPGNILYKLEDILLSKGQRLASGFVIPMPDNSVFFTPQPKVQHDMVERAREDAQRIAGLVRQLKAEGFKGRRKVILPILSKGMSAIYRYGGVLNLKSCDAKKCNQCGICPKICPVGNVSLSEGKAVWGDHCRECFACLQWCPNQAIRFGWIRVKESYRHPEVTVKDMMEQAGR